MSRILAPHIIFDIFCLLCDVYSIFTLYQMIKNIFWNYVNDWVILTPFCVSVVFFTFFSHKRIDSFFLPAALSQNGRGDKLFLHFFHHFFVHFWLFVTACHKKKYKKNVKKVYRLFHSKTEPYQPPQKLLWVAIYATLQFSPKNEQKHITLLDSTSRINFQQRNLEIEFFIDVKWFSETLFFLYFSIFKTGCWNPCFLSNSLIAHENR